MRDDQYDEYDDPDDTGVPAFPAVVTVAGVIWAGIGGLQLFSAVVNFALLGAGGAGQPGAVCGPVVSLLFGIAFLSAGIKTVRGTAKDVMGNAVGSLALGGLCLAGGVLIGVFAGAAPAAPGAPAGAWAGPIMAAVLIGAGLLYVAPGVLAIAGRKQYLAWREYHVPAERPARRRRRRDEYDDDDYDDTPRPRRRGRDRE